MSCMFLNFTQRNLTMRRWTVNKKIIKPIKTFGFFDNRKAFHKSFEFSPSCYKISWNFFFSDGKNKNKNYLDGGFERWDIRSTLEKQCGRRVISGRRHRPRQRRINRSAQSTSIK